MTKGKIKFSESTAAHVISLEGNLRTEEPLRVTCTCGEWSFGPSESLITLGLEAKKHSDKTGHILRPHNV